MIKILLLAVVPFITQHRNVSPKTEVSTNFYGSVTGIVDKAYIEERVGAGGGGCDTNAVDALANSAVVTNALTVATTNRVAAHVANTDNPHAVTAAQVGAVPLVEDSEGNKTAVTIGNRVSSVPVGKHSLANGEGLIAFGIGSHAEGFDTVANGSHSHAEGESTYALAKGSHTSGISSWTVPEDNYAFAWNGDDTRTNPYESNGPGTFNINPVGGLDGFYIGEQTLYAILTNKADKADISATDPTFSNAVLAVQISTNDFAALYALKDAFADLPIDPVTGGISVGGLLAALAAAVAWLKKNKVQTLKLNDNSVETSADGGIAKLDDFFTESNSLLTGLIASKTSGKADESDLKALADKVDAANAALEEVA